VSEAAGRRRGGDQIIPRPAAWRPGEDAPWASITTPARIETAAVAGAVAARGLGAPPSVSLPGSKQSAVLIALFDGDAGAEIVLTRRAQHLRNHHGEVSFPGGRLEPGESAPAAAIREAHEEVGLDPAAVTVVGELDHLATMVSRSVIVPVVATLPGRPDLRAACTEVDRIMTVPLVELLADDVYRQERWGKPPLDRPIHFFELDDETVWGATARMLVQLLTIATGTAA
jgi:8-oxo-dGTP pyrophosphatase MutT (NUDIX family)